MDNWLKLPFFDSWQADTIHAYIRAQEKAGKTILPLAIDRYKAFLCTPIDQVKVVILGQDPYPTASPKIHANGLAFSVNGHVKPLPKSLQNIFIELENDLGIKRENGDLTDWAEQGVLLLNTSLSVEEGKPGSHANLGWAVLTKQAIEAVSTHHKNVVFVLWGNHARLKGRYIETDNHLILESAHPSPLSAKRGFFGSKPFSKINQYLVSVNKTPIKWG